MSCPEYAQMRMNVCAMSTAPADTHPAEVDLGFSVDDLASGV